MPSERYFNRAQTEMKTQLKCKWNNMWNFEVNWEMVQRDKYHYIMYKDEKPHKITQKQKVLTKQSLCFSNKGLKNLCFYITKIKLN